MKKIKLKIILFLLGIGWVSNAQNAKIKGVVLNEDNHFIPNVNIAWGTNQISSNAQGFFEIVVPTNQKVILVFTHISYKPITVHFKLKKDEILEFNPIMSQEEQQMGEVVINSKNRKRILGIRTIDPGMLNKISGANAGVENILKTLPGVNSNSELSTQYAVRGGNYDENLVYVNEIEIYRPFLIRSGQQEGLSFTNSDLVQQIDFSAGGFQAKFGDKLASVLDITYRKPTAFAASLEASFLGGSFSLDAVSKDRKWSAVTGIRYRNNSLLVKSQETQTNFTPVFADIQTYINYQASAKWQWSFLGNVSKNEYQFQPLTRQTNFGTIEKPLALLVFYEGQEKDQYNTYFGALKTTFKATENTSFKWISSLYHTTEQEFFDILAQYRLGEIDSNVASETFGKVAYSKGIGSQLNHARNQLDALIATMELKGLHDWKKHQLEWGLKYTHESIRDRIAEWEVIDSLGFSIPPPKIVVSQKDEPNSVYTGPFLPYQNVRATNFTTIDRFSGFAQWSSKTKYNNHYFFYNFGVRFQHWSCSENSVNPQGQFVWSPRAQLTFQPDWEKDMIFRLSGGVYHQPPFYRELRDANGKVKPDVKAQKSIHFVFSNDYQFKIWNRPFKLVSELYYKFISDVNTYTIDNVRIRYAANNEAKAYAQGVDLRLNGEFVPGTESWISFGYLKTEENTRNQGYIARPTDQLLKFAMLFQDYMPNIPSMRVYLNLVYNTGLPGGSPAYADPYLYQYRLRDYRRADIGFSKILIANQQKNNAKKTFKNWKELTVGIEIFNLFNNQNAITNTWVRDVYSKNQYAIPNYMTNRVFNLKLIAKL